MSGGQDTSEQGHNIPLKLIVCLHVGKGTWRLSPAEHERPAEALHIPRSPSRHHTAMRDGRRRKQWCAQLSCERREPSSSDRRNAEGSRMEEKKEGRNVAA